MKPLTLFFGRNRNTNTSIEEYEAKWERIFGKKECHKPIKLVKDTSNEKSISSTDNQHSAGF